MAVSYTMGGMQVIGITNRILRRTFGPKRDEKGDRRRVHNGELHSSYSSLNIFRVFKSMIKMGRSRSHN